jgi:5,5'-dehydrodivanillate O-demethylase
MARAKRIDLVHVGPETLTGRFIRRFWQPVYLARDLQPGWAKRIQILSEHFTLYRGEGGEAHVVQDRCPHRNTQLSIGWIEGDDLRCFYHGWKFAPGGACLEQPCERESFAPRSRSGRIRRAIPPIFAYLGEGEPPLRALPRDRGGQRLPAVELRVDRHTIFSSRVENDLDEAQSISSMSRRPRHWRDAGVRHRRPTAASCASARGAAAPRPDALPDADAQHDAESPPSTRDDIWAVHLAWRVPVNDEKTQSFVVGRRNARQPPAGKTFAPADEIVKEILDGRTRLRDVDPDHPMLFNIQDNVAIGAQGAVYDERETERLGQSDASVILLRKLYERELRALDGADEDVAAAAGQAAAGFIPKRRRPRERRTWRVSECRSGPPARNASRTVLRRYGSRQRSDDLKPAGPASRPWASVTCIAARRHRALVQDRCPHRNDQPIAGSGTTASAT